MKINKIDLDKLNQLSPTELAQLEKLLIPRLTKFIPHTPTPKQAAFLNLDCPEAFFGGAAGGGKSDALLMAALQYVDIKGYSAILFRKTFSDLVKPEALIDRAKEWLSPFYGAEVKWKEKERKFTFYQSYGPHKEQLSVLQFGYLDSENDRYLYQGGAYNYIGFDELTHFSEANYRYLFSRARKLVGSNIPLRVRSASNPPDKFVPLFSNE